ncbi:MAG: flavodoxin domain-containing protein [Pseudomonadota bacterium]
MNKPHTELLQEILRQGQTPEKSDVPEFIPPGSPFDEAQRAYLNGLFAGIYAFSKNGASGESEQAQTPLTVLFGSQTGTAESLSKDLRKFSRTQGFDAQVSDLDDVAVEDLAAMQHLVIVAATYGEGEPTDNAQSFYAALMAEDAPALPPSLNYSVCGLGDSSYPHFNQVGRDLDARLEALGATRAAPLVTCDVDYDDDYGAWRAALFAAPAFAEAAGAGAAVPAEEVEAGAPVFDKNHPFIATLISSCCLNGEGSAKAVNHVEIALTGGGEDLAYEVGDALGVWPLNDMTEVDTVLEAAALRGTEIVSLKSGESTLRQALFRSLDLVTITPKTADSWELTLETDTQLIDVLRDQVSGLSAQQLVDGLRPLQPRLYSISSSPRKHPGEVHLTVGEVHYELNGTARKGVASTFLGTRLGAGGALGVYVHRSPHFAIPDDDESPLIMIGPGTGIAPFRAFLEEREMRGADGRNWLFFGDQHRGSDFLYEEQLTGWESSGLLDKLSVAWSRDGAEKVYVQHLIKKEGAEFFQWLEHGAAIYICGDATRMAVDVEETLIEVISEHGGLEVHDANAYLEALRKSQRYQRDVY